MEEFDSQGLVASAYAAFRAGTDGLDALADTLSEDIVWHIPVGDGSVTIDIFDRDSVVVFLDLSYRVGITDGSFGISDEKLWGNDEVVTAQHTASASFEGKEWRDVVTLVCHIKDERIAEVWQIFQNPDDWQTFWAFVGATPSDDSALGPHHGIDPVDLVARAYACVTPNWRPQALRSLLADEVVWHGIGSGGPTDYVGAQSVMSYLGWPQRVHSVSGHLSLTDVRIEPNDDGTVTGTHKLTQVSTNGTTFQDTVTLIIRVDDDKIIEVWQTFENPGHWQF